MRSLNSQYHSAILDDQYGFLLAASLFRSLLTISRILMQCGVWSTTRMATMTGTKEGNQTTRDLCSGTFMKRAGRSSYGGHATISLRCQRHLKAWWTQNSRLIENISLRSMFRQGDLVGACRLQLTNQCSKSAVFRGMQMGHTILPPHHRLIIQIAHS